MANEGQANFQVPPELRAIAEQSIEQVKKAFDGFIAATQRTVSTLEGQAAAAQAGVKDVQQKAVDYTERNIEASFEFAQKLMRAKDPQEVMRLYAGYVSAQVQILTGQARELGQTAAKAAMTPAHPKS